MRVLPLIAATSLALAGISSARATMLVNGGMEKDNTTPINPYNLVYVSPTLNSTALPGWAITSGTIDIAPNSYFTAAEGSFSVDMVGTPGLGVIQQTVTTAAATDYTLTFALAGNPELGPFDETGTTKVLRIEAFAADGTTVLATQDYQITKGTRTPVNMQWVSDSFNFTAADTSTTLRLSALTPLNLPAGATSANVQTGPVIDNLVLAPTVGAIPEPGTLGFLGAAIIVILARRQPAQHRPCLLAC